MDGYLIWGPSPRMVGVVKVSCILLQSRPLRNDAAVLPNLPASRNPVVNTYVPLRHGRAGRS